MVKYKIGIFGSSIRESKDIYERLRRLGEYLADQNVILVTGAGPGVPYEVASVAYRKNRTEIWGFSPTRNLEEQMASTKGYDNSIYSRMFYIPDIFEFSSNIEVSRKYRNVLSTAVCDAGIIIAGRWGTLNEFTNLYDMGKVIGVMIGTGGASDVIQHISSKIKKQSKATVRFNSVPEDLAQQIIDEIKKRRVKGDYTPLQ